MFKKIVVKSIGLVFCIGFIMLVVNVNIGSLSLLPNKGYVSYQQLNEINQSNIYGKFVTVNLDEQVNVGNKKNNFTTLKFKLFGIIPIKQVSVKVSEDKPVFVGGIPLGFSLQTKGLLIVGQNSVLTKDGNVVTDSKGQLSSGDIITHINDNEINNVDDLKRILGDNNKEYVKITALRKNKTITANIKPALDLQSNTYKLGYWVKNNASGVGTLTFVDEEKKFGALGHPITDYETGAVVPVSKGDVYNCSLIGVNKAEKGRPGELKCLFLQGKNTKGVVKKNTTSGVFGDMTDTTGIVDENKKAVIGSRLNVKSGKAYIVSSVSGVREEYEIEIIKVNSQSSQSDKSLVFRVKDKKLLSITGGILQGMSGSPIIQDGKLIGAVTHVFLNDCTKGYGIYVDWMLEEIV